LQLGAEGNEMADCRAGEFGTEHDGNFGLRFEGSFERGKLSGYVACQLSFAGGQPMNGRGFLAIADVHKLRGFALELDVLRIDKEEFRIEVADAGTNLPGDQRVLLRGIVANDENRFRLVKLLHGERRIGGALAKSLNQAGVIRGAVMIDVVGAEGAARQALK